MSPEQSELLLDLHGERWLLERLQQHNADVYCEGEFPEAGDRLAHVIVAAGLASVVAGRGRDGKPETYAQVWSRLYGRPFKAPKQAKSDSQPPAAAQASTTTG